MSCPTTQGFGENANPSYSGQGLKGHSGVDEGCLYGTPVMALKKGIVFKIIDDARPASDGSGYFAVFILSQDASGAYCEWQAGHLSEITCKIGDMVEPNSIIGKVGNKGTVFQGGIQITKAMQDAGDRRGTHIHWNKKILTRQNEAQRDADRKGVRLNVYGAGTYEDAEGYVYAINDFSNGYKGSVDPKDDLVLGYKEANAMAVGGIVKTIQAIVSTINSSELTVAQRLSFLSQMSIIIAKLKAWLAVK